MESLDNKWILKGDREGDEEDHCKEKIKYQKIFFRLFLFFLSQALPLQLSHSRTLSISLAFPLSEAGHLPDIDGMGVGEGQQLPRHPRTREYARRFHSGKSNALI